MAREMIIVPYDQNWPVLFKREEQLLKEILGGLAQEVHHCGSTAIPGISAKPIIDIIIVVEDIMEIDRYNQAMEAGGYSVRGQNGIPGRRYFVRLHPDGSGNHTHHIHIYQRGNPHVADELMFRDYLRVNQQALQEYESVKLEAADRYRHSPLAYVKAKEECVMRLTREAREYYRRLL